MKVDVICFGEILWDVFPARQVIGGAPLNVALRLHREGVATTIVSCVGDDELGITALDFISKEGLNISNVQKTETLPTGKVFVTLNQEGNASYEIALPVAWDAIALSDKLVDLVKETPFFVFGSLAARSPFNRNTLDQLLKVAQTSIFDVNLRAPYYHIDMVYELMQRANVIKMNEDELVEIATALGCEAAEREAQIRWLSKITNTTTICVTRGAGGAMLFYKDVIYEHQGYTILVTDTVGAGDSFLAILIASLFIDNLNPEAALARASAVGALVASKEGGNCEVSEGEIALLIAKGR